MTVTRNTSDLWLDRFPWPADDTHKHRRGALVVVSGPMSRTGAARLAARAGLRIGAGLVTVLSPPDALLVNAINLEAVMVRAFGSPEVMTTAARGARAAVIGPAAGIGPGTIDNVTALRDAGCALVLDADALTSFEAGTQALFDLLDHRDVLTPHEGEFERLWPGLLAQGRTEAVAEAARQSGACVLLKGPRTLLAAPDGRLVSNETGAAWLATAGSGDVLAGTIGGLIAQGVEAFDAACMAAWIHAEAGAAFGPGLIAEDLPDQLPAILRRLYEKGRAS
jgi:hydroxyethylthiazole kinase-like uncharacterized protein yjeF